MAEIVVHTLERDGVRYELVTRRVELDDFAQIGQIDLPVRVRVTPVEEPKRV